MNVLYVSKASRVAAHRDKLGVMKEMEGLTLVLPHRWGDQPDEEPLATDPPTIALPALLHGHNHLHLYRGLGAVIDRVRPDLVHVDEEPYSAVTLQAARASRKRSVPFVFFAWQNIDKKLPPGFGALRRAVFRSAAGGIAGTETAGQVLRRAGFTGPLAVIPQMGVDPARFRPDPEGGAKLRRELGIPPGRRVVGYVGRLVAEKGLGLLLEAAAELPNADVLLVGGGALERDLRERARSLGIAERVHFGGAVASEAVPRWLAAMDVLALPSLSTSGWSEQFGRVLIEAMAVGVAVLGSSSGEIASVIGDAGRVVPEGSARELRRALHALLSDDAARARVAAAGRARALERFSQRAVAAATVEFHERVLSASRSSASDRWRSSSLDGAGGRAAEGIR